MREIILEGRFLTEKETAHEYLQETLNLPQYYGKNLDALYDSLTDFEEAEIKIRISEQKTVYLEKILRVFKAASRENNNIKLIFNESLHYNYEGTK